MFRKSVFMVEQFQVSQTVLELESVKWGDAAPARLIDRKVYAIMENLEFYLHKKTIPIITIRNEAYLHFIIRYRCPFQAFHLYVFILT